MKKISEFLSEKFQFLVVKFSVYLNRRVFVMPNVRTNMVRTEGVPILEKKKKKKTKKKTEKIGV